MTGTYLALIVSVAMMCMLFVYALLYRKERGVRYFMWVMACRVVYACCVIMELSIDSLADKLLFRSMQQSALTMIVPLMILCVLDLLGKDKWLKLRWQCTLFFVFVLWAALIWANPYLGIVNEPPILVEGHLEQAKTVYGMSFNIVCYAILAVCVVLLIRYLLHARPEIRRPGIWMVLLGTMTFSVEIVKVAMPQLSPWLLPLSVYSGIFGMTMLWIIFRYRLFSIIPIARNVVVDSMREGTLIADHKGRIIDGNRYLQPLFDPKTILGQEIGELLAPWPAWQAACRRMEERDLEIASPTEDGHQVYRVKVYPLLSQRKRKLGSVSVLFNITDKQRRMEQIAHLNQMKDQLFTVVSHDIRDPLAVQVNLIEVLEDEKHSFPPDNAELIDALSQQIRNTYMMVENLLEWFRSQKEGIILHPESLELAEMVQEACRMLMVKSEAKRIKLRVSLPEGLRVNADREALVLVLRNVLSNAIKFSNRGGVIDVGAETSGKDAVVSVRDYGVGMNERQLRELFDESRFESLPGTEGEKGTGLGLFVSQQFIRMCGGYIRAEGRPGEGSTFYVVMKQGQSD